MVNVLAYAIPVGAVAVGLYLLLKPSAAKAAPADMTQMPPALSPGQLPTTVSGGARAQKYLLELEAAATAWKAAIPLMRDVQKTMVLGTVQVVKGMAANDALQGGITVQDLATINARADAIYNEVSAAVPTKPAEEPAPETPADLPGPKTMAELQQELVNVEYGWQRGEYTNRNVEDFVWDLMKRSELLLNAGAISQSQYDQFKQQRSDLLVKIRMT